MRRQTTSPALVTAISLLVVACANPPPMVVNPAFTDPPRPAGQLVSTPPNCQLDIADIVDARRSPDMLGIVVGRAVKAPDDRAAWLRSVVNGLASRGFSVVFDNSVKGHHSVVVRMTLTTAWVTETSMNKDANVVWRVAAERPGSPLFEREYRGALSMMNWNNGVGELRGLVDRAFAKALDSMSADLHGLCGI